LLSTINRDVVPVLPNWMQVIEELAAFTSDETGTKHQNEVPSAGADSNEIFWGTD